MNAISDFFKAWFPVCPPTIIVFPLYSIFFVFWHNELPKPPLTSTVNDSWIFRTIFLYANNLEHHVWFFTCWCANTLYTPILFLLWLEYLINMTKLPSQPICAIILAFSVSCQSWRNVYCSSTGLSMFGAVRRKCVFFWYFSVTFDPWNQPTN